MKCQYCHENEATLNFLVQWMGMERNVHICESCAEKWKQYVGLMQKQYTQNQSTPFGWFYPQNQEKQRGLGNSPFLHVTGDEVKKKRELNALKYQLQYAIDTEHYEEAARLRDEIEKGEKEMVPCE